jgi:hypothetical protein
MEWTKERSIPVADNEVLEGYVVDIACLRKWPRLEISERAIAHTRQCALEGHCVESGYALIDDTGNPMHLGSEATPMVVAALLRTSRQREIRMAAERQEQDGRMRTTSVRLLE